MRGMKVVFVALLALVLSMGCVAPKKSGLNLLWEVPVSAALFPIDSLHVVEQSRNQNRALKGDADSAYKLALAHVRHGGKRSFFKNAAETWYLRAKELGHPETTKPFAEWKKKNEGSILFHDSTDPINPMDPIVVPLLIDAFF